MGPEFLEYAFMQRALVAGAVTAIVCPSIGVFLVPRRLSLIADTLAHVALAGVALPRWTPKTGQSWTPENRPVR
jgi:ABC-type Mn2+/Zn2+ transport system permease subunit